MKTDVVAQVRVWTVPKPDAESTRENEDRFWLAGLRPQEPLYRPLIAVLSDGASDGLFAREWSRSLARAAAGATTCLPADIGAIAERARQAWQHRAAATTLPWFLEARRSRPTGATLLRFALYPDGRWDAFAVGDSCLVRAQGGNTSLAFPIERFDDFSLAPSLIVASGSREQDTVRVGRDVAARGGAW